MKLEKFFKRKLKIKKIKSEFWLILIVFFAVIVKLIFFVGLVGSDPQDDGIYYNNAYGIYKFGIQKFSSYRNVGKDYLANPAETFAFRPMVNYPIAFLFKIFGPGENSASLWAFICSVLGIITIFYLGKLLINETSGLLAAFLLSINPLDVIFSTRITSDVPLAFFMALTVLLFLSGLKKNKNKLYFLAGITLGLAYLVKILALSIVPFVLVYYLYQWYKIKKFQKGLFFLGFLIVFSCEAIFYYAQSEDFLLNYHITSSAYKFKYEREGYGTLKYGLLNIYYNTGVPIFHLENVFGLATHRPGVNLAGYFYFLIIPAIVYSLYKRKNYFLVFWGVALFLYLEFGFVSIKPDFEKGIIHYYMIFKDPRFLTLVSYPFMLLLSYFFYAILKFNKIVFLIIFTALIASSFYYIYKDYLFYRGSLNDLRVASEFISNNPNNLFYSDFIGINNIDIITNHKLTNLRYMNTETKMEDLNNSYVILGGSRGVDIVTDHVLTYLPDFAKNITKSESIPKNWKLVLTVTGEIIPIRQYDLKIYYVS
ncbi:MAG: glycosyltransferase family 39 protein [Candidatus Aenigmarchaeota archaeon]|nr:glycosyltransferase family 39 protein [Candidatus Aenigmarchaeota archaeon]